MSPPRHTRVPHSSCSPRAPSRATELVPPALTDRHAAFPHLLHTSLADVSEAVLLSLSGLFQPTSHVTSHLSPGTARHGHGPSTYVISHICQHLMAGGGCAMPQAALRAAITQSTPLPRVLLPMTLQPRSVHSQTCVSLPNCD